MSFRIISADSKIFTVDDILLNDKHHHLFPVEFVNLLKNWFDNEEFISIYSSGSTGVPKQIKLNKNSLRKLARNSIEILKYTVGSVSVLAIPASRIGGVMVFVRALELGAPLIVLTPKSNPLINFSFTQFDYISLVPSQVADILNNVNSTEILNSFKTVLIGGAPVNSLLNNKLQNLNCEFYETYGMSETGSHIALRKINGGQKSDWFTPIKGFELKLSDKNLLMVNGLITNYEWLTTNDRVEFDGFGRFRVLGRADFVINSGGLKFFPEEIENKISSSGLFGGLEFYVSSIPDAKLGEKLVIVFNMPLLSDWEYYKTKLAEHLNSYEIPKKYFIVSEFPLNRGLKIDRLELKKHLLLIALRDNN